ncbi:MAG TPA: LysM peptidoglycan-binding domain-containing protein [Solirubrobacteraceae bacterium]|nr:LysM peptidoglycan-binding domain-containing protein [Solirubrobacteraceae bacterium]
MSVKKIALATAALALALPGTALADFSHVVEPGETLSSIAAADGLSLAALAAANGLSSTSELQAGQIVQIPPQDAATAASSSSGAGTEGAGASSTTVGSGVTPAGSYVVQPGDSLSAIAARAGTSVAQLAALNGIDPAGILLIGTTLTLPGGGGSAPSASAAGPATGTGNQQITGATASGPYPTAQVLSGAQVGAAASAVGADPALAEAVGWQESGFNNDLVSPSGAVGVMQIEPATWSWINEVLTPGAPLDPSSALDNVRGGALLLNDLVAQTGSEAMAAAAYYQGLASVREHGVYASTQQYVNDVMALQARDGGS